MTSPRELVVAECGRRGMPALVDGCMALVAGDAAAVPAVLHGLADEHWRPSGPSSHDEAKRAARARAGSAHSSNPSCGVCVLLSPTTAHELRWKRALGRSALVRSGSVCLDRAGLDRHTRS